MYRIGLFHYYFWLFFKTLEVADFEEILKFFSLNYYPLSYDSVKNHIVWTNKHYETSPFVPKTIVWKHYRHYRRAHALLGK